MSKELDVIIKNRKVRQSNNFIESPYAQEFTAYEIKIFEIGVASCSQEDIKLFELKNDKEFELSNGELAKFLNTKPNVISMEIEKTAKRIMKKTIHLRKILDDGTVEFEMINIIPYARYKDGVFKFRLNYSIIPYLVEINKNFTEYQLHYLLSLRSSYAIKIYKLLYQYRNIKKRIFKVDELKEQCGVLDKYPQYKSFKQRILLPSIQQINELTDLHIDFKEIKMGRKVSQLVFNFSIVKSITDIELLPVKNIEKVEKTSNNKTSWNKFVDFYYNLYGEIKSYQRINEFNSLSQNKIIEIYNYNKYEAVVLARYVLDKAKQDVNSYLIRHGVNGVSYINQKDVEKLKNKIEGKSVEEKVKIKQKEEENKEHKERNDIKHQFYKLLDTEKNKYTNYAELLCKKHKSNPLFTDSEKVVFSVYAVSNNKKYIYPFEKYCKENNINLSIYK